MFYMSKKIKKKVSKNIKKIIKMEKKYNLFSNKNLEKFKLRIINHSKKYE